MESSTERAAGNGDTLLQIAEPFFALPTPSPVQNKKLFQSPIPIRRRQSDDAQRIVQQAIPSEVNPLTHECVHERLDAHRRREAVKCAEGQQRQNNVYGFARHKALKPAG